MSVLSVYSYSIILYMKLLLLCQLQMHMRMNKKQSISENWNYNIVFEFMMFAAGPLVCYPKWGSGDQSSRGKDGDSVHGQQFWHLTITGQAVHEWRSSHQG